jgi:hypothetical protein
MSRRAARFTMTELRRMARVAKDEGVVIEVDGVRVMPEESLPNDGKARNPSGYVEARLADAPWAKSK